MQYGVACLSYLGLAFQATEDIESQPEVVTERAQVPIIH